MLGTLFKSHAATKILDVLLDLPDITLSKAWIAREAKVSWKTVHAHIPTLLKHKILKKKDEGFIVVEKSPMTKALLRVDYLESCTYR